MELNASQQYRFLVVLDLEATCEEVQSPSSQAASSGRLQQEIIEFPWAVIDVQEAKVISQRQLYVKPEWEGNVQLSAFCTKLTGITDAVLAEKGLPLKDCLDIFAQAMQELSKEAPPDSICVVTDGVWDLDMQLRREAAAKGLTVPPHLLRFIDVRQEVSHFYKPGREHHLKGLKSLLRFLGLAHQGRHHSGIDDVLNICQIMFRLASDGHTFTPGSFPRLLVSTCTL
jgi:ERI1 exoribonuclease 3